MSDLHLECLRVQIRDGNISDTNAGKWTRNCHATFPPNGLLSLLNGSESRTDDLNVLQDSRQRVAFCTIQDTGKRASEARSVGR